MRTSSFVLSILLVLLSTSAYTQDIVEEDLLEVEAALQSYERLDQQLRALHPDCEPMTELVQQATAEITQARDIIRRAYHSRDAGARLVLDALVHDRSNAAFERLMSHFGVCNEDPAFVDAYETLLDLKQARPISLPQVHQD